MIMRLSFSSTIMATNTRTRTTHLRTFWPKTSLAHDMKAAAFEFVGTTVFLLLAFGGVQASNDVQGSALERTLYIATSFGLSLLVSAWFFFRATGGLFNPDVSLALLLAGCIGPMRFVLYCVAQLTGAIAAAGIVLALTPGPLSYEYVVARSIPFSKIGQLMTFRQSGSSPKH
jgi:aquaporin rerated protein, other eukaryote